MRAVPDALATSLDEVEATIDRLLQEGLDLDALEAVKTRLNALMDRIVAAWVRPKEIAVRDHANLVVQRLAEHGADHGIDEILRARGVKSEDELRSIIKTAPDEPSPLVETNEDIPEIKLPADMLDDVVRRSGGQPALYGLTSSLPVEILIGMAQTNPKPGRLWIRTETEVLWFDVRDGRIARACGLGPEIEGERLGELAVGMGIMGPDEIRNEIDNAIRKGIPLGMQLLERGVITVERLREALRRQSLSRFSRALKAKHAAYAFSVTKDPANAAPTNIGFDGRHLLLECARHRDEAKNQVIHRHGDPRSKNKKDGGEKP